MKEGWQTKTLAELLVVLRNGVNCKQDRSGGDSKVSRIESISDARFNADKVGYAVLSDQEKERFRLRQGDILFSHINSPVHVGKTAIFDSDEEVYHGVNLLLMRPSSEVSSAYLECYLKFLFQSGYWRSVCKQSVNQASVNQQDISRVRISFPSLPEQQRIVALLDEVFACLATAKVNAERNHQNAHAVFEGYLETVFSCSEDGWVRVPLGQAFKTATGSTPSKSIADFYGDFVPLVKPPELRDELFASAFDGLSESGAAVARVLPVNSVLVSCIGNIGKVGLNTVPVAFNQQINAILPDASLAVPEFIFFQALSPFFRSQLISKASGTTVSIVNKSKFNGVCVALPPLRIQEAVVKQLCSLRAETQRLAHIYERKLVGLEDLKKSILQQAFNGEL